MNGRQTDFTLDQIREMLKTGQAASGGKALGALCKALVNGLPIGLVFNEIGLIFLAGGDEGRRAETDLLDILQGEPLKERDVAYFYLKTGSCTAVTSPEALAVIAAFEAAPQNAETVKFVGEKLKALAA